MKGEEGTAADLATYHLRCRVPTPQGQSGSIVPGNLGAFGGGGLLFLSLREVCRSSQETKQGPSLVSPCGFQMPAPSLPVLGNVGAQAPLRLCGGNVRDGYGDEQAWPHSPMLGGRLRCKCRVCFWRVTTDDALGWKWNGAPGSVGLDMRRRPTGDMFALGGSEL